VTLYVVAFVGLTLISDPVCPLLQLYSVPPEAFNTISSPLQMVKSSVITATNGAEGDSTLTVTLSISSHPSLLTVTP